MTDDLEETSDDPQAPAISQEMDRIMGPDRPGEPPFKFFWLLPLTSGTEFLALLQSIPSSVGAAGMECAIRNRFPDLPEHSR